MSTLEEDTARPDTPLASKQNIPVLQSNENGDCQAQHSFALSDVVNENDASLEGWPAEFSDVEINIAPDGTYLETSNGLAARELKRRYDVRYGVSLTVRSPYAITSFVNQHGKQMFRIGHRELSAPAASAAEVAAEIEDRNIQAKPDVSSSPRAKRPSRMSMHTIFPPVFMKSGSISVASQNGSNPKKLRKARSIPSIGGVDVSEQGELNHYTGRAHSQSVTAADVPRYAVQLPSRTVDIFGELMDWPAASSSMTSLSSYASSGEAGHINHPFGAGVSFESPTKKPHLDFLPPPTRHLRLMQSFESGLTARQDDSPTPAPSPLPKEATTDAEPSRPASAIRVTERRQSFLTEAQRPSSTYQPPAEASMLTQYSITVFDVLQTYRGLPSLDKLGFEAESKTVKLSASDDHSAAPRDDPRFVIWGETAQEWDHDGYSVSRESITSDSSSSRPQSSISKRRSRRVSKSKASEPASRRSSISSGSRIIIAATIERWIAQLTSTLDYNELLNFFLTYRTYISGVDLAHILISRFHWALQRPKNDKDNDVRQVVQVRTFVAIRYWLVTFFIVDFTPNRELRVLFSNWVNTLMRDPHVREQRSAFNMIRGLAKVAKACKQAHLKTTGSAAIERPRVPKPDRVRSHVLGQRFAEAVMKDDDDSDVDLDFILDEGIPDSPLGPNDAANSHLTAAHAGTGTMLPTPRPPSLPLSSLNILQRMDQNTTGGGESGGAPAEHIPVPLPSNQGMVSRAFVKTIGRLGRLKRVLHSRTMTRHSVVPAANASTSAFDLDISVSLPANGTVDRFVQPVHPVSAKHPPPPSLQHPSDYEVTVPVPSAPPVLETTPVIIAPNYSPNESTTTLPPPPGLTQPTFQHPITPTTPTQQPPSVPEPELDQPKPSFPDSPPDYDVALPSLPTPPPEEAEDYRQSFQTVSTFQSSAQRFQPSHRAGSIRSFASSTGSLGEILDGQGGLQPTFGRSENTWGFDVASLDDLESDTSSEIHDIQQVEHSHGLRRQKKLPMRKDFEFLPRRSEVSSMGIASRDSFASERSGSSPETTSGVVGMRGPIQQWQINAIVAALKDDEEDDGGPVEALRRLEGQIKNRDATSRVNGWMKEMELRQLTGDYEDVEPRYSDDEDSGDEVASQADGIDNDDSISQKDVSLLSPPGLEGAGDSLLEGETPDDPHTPVPTSSNLRVPPTSSSSSDAGASKPAVEDVVPLEILQSRVSTGVSPNTIASDILKADFGFSNPDVLRTHQSFILGYRAVMLAEQFAMIDRELFMGVKFEELVTEDWMSTNEINIYDWSQYLKDRARWKAEHRNQDKTTALAALRARFNLTANFVISEVVLTPQAQRAIVVGKFIRIAWKSYEMNSFNTLVAIVTALQSDWVNQAMRKSLWSRVGSFESRVFRDLKIFASSSDGFKILRRAVDTIVKASKPMDTSSYTNSIASGSVGGENQGGRAKSNSDAKPLAQTSCVPFIGIYLTQLCQLKRLPDLVDPTCPNEPVAMNSATGDFNPPAHPEVFAALAPLPSTMRLEPLVNVHKQRRIAAVIQSLVHGQHSACRVNFEVDKRLFQRCLRLRALDNEGLHRAAATSFQ